MDTKNLLIELLVEELPPKALNKLGDVFAGVLLDQLRLQGLADSESKATAYASPRRLAAHITAVAAQAADKSVSSKLMPVSVGLDSAGNATPALLKKLQALGTDASAVGQLKRAMDGKAQALYYDSTVRGATLADGLQKSLLEAIAKLPIPKVMSYQLASGCELPGWSSVSFVRPAHGLLALYGSAVVPVQALGLHAGNSTQGHRFEAAKAVVVIANADSYADTLLNDGAVIASFAQRKAEIERQLAQAAARVGGGVQPLQDDALLDEVTALVERPNVLVCEFESAFLQVPQECLILTMKANQKYFPLLDAGGKLTHKFLVVSNISPQDASAVIGGNERVIRPRLADAKFFYDQDRKKTLASRLDGLAKVVYHNKLGSQAERAERVRAIAHAIVEQLRAATTPYTAQAKEEFAMLAHKAEQAAQLAKADLLTDMVGEFPELQGIMGGYYARHEGLRDGVAIAIEDHYKPRFAGDGLPRNHTGLVVALADKLETLVGMFGIGNLPTGDRDPFALRRHALGVIRILLEKNLPLLLSPLLLSAANAFNEWLSQQSQEDCMVFGHAKVKLPTFIYERLAGLLREQGYSSQEIEAVLSLEPQRLGDILQRLAAVRAFAALPEAPALAAANKRVGNILKKVEGTVEASVDATKLHEPAEIALQKAITSVAVDADQAWNKGQYTENLQALAALKAPIDAFFDTVMVNTEDPVLRANRLGLLATLHAAMNRVADLSKLAT